MRGGSESVAGKWTGVDLVDEVDGSRQAEDLTALHFVHLAHSVH
jgi:hypothetical protein